MSFSTKQLHIMIVEDNPGDYLLIEEYILEDVIKHIIKHIKTLIEVKEELSQGTLFDVILLDLSLPDSNGEALVKEVLKAADGIPVIVLTGYSDKDFGVKSLALGVSDYLLKDELSASLLFKSATYSIERRKINVSLIESERKYKEIFHFNPVPMWVFDPETFRFLDVNDAAIAHYGYSRHEFLCMSILDIRIRKDIKDIRKSAKDLSIFSNHYRGISEHRKKNGEAIFVDIQGSIIDFSGKKGELILAIDITEKLQSEKALQISEQRFKAMVQEGADLITVIDKDGFFKYISPNHKTILGYETEDLLGKNVFKFTYKDDIERILQIIRSFDVQKNAFIFPYRFINANGNWIWLETTITNLLNDPAVEGIISNSRDITQRMTYEQTLRETNERYEAVARATSDAIWDCDLRTNKTFVVGDGYEKLFGYTINNEYLAVDFWESCLHIDDKERVLKELNDARSQSRTQWQSEYRFLKADGNYAYVYDRAFIIYENGVAIRILGAMQDITMRKYQEAILAIEKEVYALNATRSVSFDEVLEKLIKSIEYLIPHSLGSILKLTDNKSIKHIAGKSLPSGYIKSINGIAIGPLVGSCGTAMYTGKSVIVTDIDNDIFWKDYLTIAQKFGLKACWSIPIKNSSGEVIGSFATYYKHIKSPKEYEINFIERAASLVGVLLENREASEKVKVSKERYDIVAKATSDTIWDFDILKDTITYNKGIMQVFGYSVSKIEPVRNWWKDKIHPDDFKQVMDTLEDVVQKRQSNIKIEYRFRCADGSYKYVLDRGFIVLDKGHNPVRIIGAMQDITRQKEEENRLRLLESVVTNTTDAILITEAEPIDAFGPKIVYANHAFSKMTGYTIEEVIGKDPRFLQGDNTNREELNRLRKSLENWETCEIEIINYKKSGEEFWINIAIAPVADSSGRFTHWIAVERDITERKNKEIEREQLIKELNQSNEDLRHFSYITSHNFKAPLSNLIGLLKIVEDIPIDNPLLEQIIKGFSTSTTLLNETINDLIKILVIRDSNTIEQKKITFAKITDQVVVQLESLICEVQAEINTDFHLGASVIFNETYLESILLNLFTNAIKYRSYSRPLKINIITKNVDNKIILIFEDNGIGLDVERHKTKIFGLYQRFHDRPNSKGMGLYLVKSQIESLGGSIDIESKIDVGTKFILKFER